MVSQPLDTLLDLLWAAIENSRMVKLTLSKTRKKNSEPKRVTIKPVALKSGLRYSFQYSYHTRDEVKNFTIEDTPAQV